MDVDAKVTAIHTVAGIIAGYLSFLLSGGFITGVGKNEVLAVVMALIILYISGNISERLFGKEEVGGTKGWLWSGIVPYFFVWILVWVIFLNI
jgi:EMC6-arch